MSNKSTRTLSFLVFRGTSRLTGILLCGMIVLLLSSEGLYRHGKDGWIDLLPILIWMFLLILSLVWSWFHELMGGILLITLGMAQAAFQYSLEQNKDAEFILLLCLPPVIPGAFFLLTGILKNIYKTDRAT